MPNIFDPSYFSDIGQPSDQESINWRRVEESFINNTLMRGELRESVSDWVTGWGVRDGQDETASKGSDAADLEESETNKRRKFRL